MAMTEKTLETKRTRTPIQPPTTPRVVTIQKVVDAVREDAQVQPQKYLDESLSPKGGE
jgi:hypothetical protein